MAYRGILTGLTKSTDHASAGLWFPHRGPLRDPLKGSKGIQGRMSAVLGYLGSVLGGLGGSFIDGIMSISGPQTVCNNGLLGLVFKVLGDLSTPQATINLADSTLGPFERVMATILEPVIRTAYLQA